MSDSLEEFKKVIDFWRSLEENNVSLRSPCSYFRRRTLIKSEIEQRVNEVSENQYIEVGAGSNVLKSQSLVVSDDECANRKISPEFQIEQPVFISTMQIQLKSNTNKALQPVKDEEYNQETRCDKEAQDSLESQTLSPEIIITEEKPPAKQPTEGPDNQYIEERAGSNLLERIEEQLLCPFGFVEKLEHEFSDDKCANREILPELQCEKKILSPGNIINDSDSFLSDIISNDGSVPAKSTSIIFPSTNIEETNPDEAFFDDNNWLLEKNHIFVLSFAGKPIFSLHKHGYEDKMSSLFALIQCFINIFEVRKDRISSIEAEGVKLVFLVRNSLYLVAASRENISTYHLKMRLREAYNRIGFLLTFANLNHIFENTPGYDLRRQLCGNYNLISNQLANKMKVSNNIFTLFTNTIRVLPLHPVSRSNLINIIRKKCSKIDNLAFAMLIVEDQLVALVRLRNHSIHAADIRLIFNLLECSENLFNNFHLWMLPICLPNFDKNCYLHAYISCISNECDAFLILLSHNREMVEEISKAHGKITAALRASNWFTNICQQTHEGNGFNIDVLNMPKLWHFIYIPKSTNHQLLCSKITPPYTCLEEFKHLEAIYRDLHYRINKECRPLKLIFEAKEKEVALALKTHTAEIYAVFDPLIGDYENVVSYYIHELVSEIMCEEKTYFIRKYPKFK